MSMSVWTAACRLLAKHLASGERLDALMEALPGQMPAEDKRRCRHLLYGTVRHLGLLDAVLATHLAKTPRPMLRAVLLAGAFELMEHAENAPVIVHHWVGVARQSTSAGEARLVNAVLRRMPAALAVVTESRSREPAALALRFSHPEWLVRRWIERFGEEATLALLGWDQQPAPVHARVVDDAQVRGTLPDFFHETRWPGFYRLERLDWPVVEAMLTDGRVYIQDPATAIAPGLLAPSAGETLLDVCAAPGGKTFQLAEKVGPGGRVIAIDLKGARLERLRRNLAARSHLPVTVFGADATTLTTDQLAGAELPIEFDAALVDAPCSNTGVLQHRVDVKTRLQPSDLDGLARLQLAILQRTAALVRAGGRLVYSTCSLEKEENEDVVAVFLREAGEAWSLERAEHSRPWESGCDGAGAFLLRRSS
ncbi:MAG: RsmB/NOP family class I SAM-dependent RNA methyltransferase [Opitutaceae bacterium]